MIFQCHHKGVLPQFALGDKGFNLFLAVFCIAGDDRFFKIEQHENQRCGYRQCRQHQQQKATDGK